MPGRKTSPETANNFMPGDFSVPKDLYQAAPFLIIAGTEATVSTLLTTVGDAYNPATAGNGGFSLG